MEVILEGLLHGY